MRAALLLGLVFLPATLTLEGVRPEKGRDERIELQALVEEPLEDGSSCGVSMEAVLRRTIRAVEHGRVTRERLIVEELSSTAASVDAAGKIESAPEELLETPIVTTVSRPQDVEPKDWLARCLCSDWDELSQMILPRREVESGDTWSVDPGALLRFLAPRRARLSERSWARATFSSKRRHKTIELEGVLRYDDAGSEGRLHVSGTLTGPFDGEDQPVVDLQVSAHLPGEKHERRSVHVERNAITNEED